MDNCNDEARAGKTLQEPSGRSSGTCREGSAPAVGVSQCCAIARSHNNGADAPIERVSDAEAAAEAHPISEIAQAEGTNDSMRPEGCLATGVSTFRPSSCLARYGWS